jgi:hypothetical protein
MDEDQRNEFLAVHGVSKNLYFLLQFERAATPIGVGLTASMGIVFLCYLVGEVQLNPGMVILYAMAILASLAVLLIGVAQRAHKSFNIKKQSPIFVQDFSQRPPLVAREQHLTELISAAPNAVKTLGDRLADILDADQWNNIEHLLLSITAQIKKLEGVALVNEKLLNRVESLESLSPVWRTFSHSNRDVAHQLADAALASIWKILDVKQQTQAMEKLRLNFMLPIDDIPLLIQLCDDMRHDSSHMVYESEDQIARLMRLSEYGWVACEQHAKGLIPHATRKTVIALRTIRDKEHINHGL